MFLSLTAVISKASDSVLRLEPPAVMTPIYCLACPVVCDSLRDTHFYLPSFIIDQVCKNSLNPVVPNFLVRCI